MKVRLASVLAIAFLHTACTDRSDPAKDRVDHISGPSMGTVYHIRFGTPLGKQSAVDLQALITERLDEIESSMSTYRPDSEISRFNVSRAGDWFPVSREFAQVADTAQEISRSTGGAFDITVGPLVELWGFGPRSRASGDRDSSSVPSAEEIATTRAGIGFSHLEVRRDPPALRKGARPKLQIDLSAIAKGFAVDAVAELLESRNISSYLVEIGGELRVGSAKPDGSPWRVGIESPDDDRRTIYQALALTKTALATSGDYRSFFISDGQRFSHLIDPRTGKPVRDAGLGSVSILAPTCQFADAMATALFVLGPVEGLDFAELRKLAALFLVRHNENFSAIMTNGFKKQAGDPTQWTGN